MDEVFGSTTQTRSSATSVSEVARRNGPRPPTNPLMQSLRSPITSAVPDLLSYLMSTPTTYRILGLEWYEYRTPIERNFVILEVGRVEYNNLWLRIDRTVGPTDFRTVSGDQAQICDFQDLLIDINATDDHIHRKLATAFRHPVPLNKLGVLLSVLLREFPRFSLYSENSYFYCLAIYENLVELGEGEYIAHGSPPQPRGIFAQEARARVKMRMQTSQNRSNRPSSSSTNLRHSPPPPYAQSDSAEAPDLTGRIVRLGSAPIATGGYSSVWRGALRSPTHDDPYRSLQVAIKVLRASHTDEHTAKRKLHKRLHAEMRIWAQLRHENVVTLLGHTQEPEGPGLVSISYSHGNVLNFLAKNPSVNREVVCADVALGLQYLHDHDPPIIHGDLKGPNVLIDGEGKASICDFGLSIILDGGPTGHTSSNFGGSLRFLAPELLEESTRTVQTDIYAYACTCIAILFDQEPYHQLFKEAHLMRAILSDQPPFEPSTAAVTFPSFLQILQRCWDHDRSNRPSLNLIFDTIERCLYRTYQANLAVQQGIGSRIRLMCLPDIEEAKLVSVADGGLSIVVLSSASFHRVPIYQRYRWELMDRENVEVPEDLVPSRFHEEESQDSLSAVVSPLSGTFTSPSESLSSTPHWKDYSAKFRLPYSSMVYFGNATMDAGIKIDTTAFSIGPGLDRPGIESSQ